MPDRHAFLFEDTIVVIDPLPGLAWVDKGESQRANAATRRHLDGLAVGAGDPERRMRFLQWFRHHISTWHLEELALEAGIRVHHHHIGALFDPLVPRPRKLMFVENPEFHWASRRGSLLAKLSGLAGRVASAFLNRTTQNAPRASLPAAWPG